VNLDCSTNLKQEMQTNDAFLNEEEAKANDSKLGCFIFKNDVNKNLGYCSKMIIFDSLLATFEASITFGGS